MGAGPTSEFIASSAGSLLTLRDPVLERGIAAAGAGVPDRGAADATTSVQTQSAEARYDVGQTTGSVITVGTYEVAR